MTLTTNAPGAACPGFRVRVLAREAVEAGPASHPPGTIVGARELFLNLTVRRGFRRGRTGSAVGTRRPPGVGERDMRILLRRPSEASRSLFANLPLERLSGKS